MTRFNVYDRIKPETAEEVQECATPEGIRRRFNRAAYRSGHPLVRAVFQMADARGLSGEDKYTILAFEVLKQLEHLEEINLEAAMLDPKSPLRLLGSPDNG